METFKPNINQLTDAVDSRLLFVRMGLDSLVDFTSFQQALVVCTGAPFRFLLAVPQLRLLLAWHFDRAQRLIIRALSPWLTGFEQPPRIATYKDSFGLGLIYARFQEVPFLLGLLPPIAARRYRAGC
jgi:ABC-type uncharacterized transport system YnjBCD permease subunit